MTWLQVNLTKRCNLACHHCHVESGPKRTEALDRPGAERILELLAKNAEVATLDLTGLPPTPEEIDAFVASCQRRVVAAGGRYLLARTDTPPEHTLLRLLRDG